ncbi:uncharacterized protein [Dysidea avara]|uniref:uncharacterized protein n=1 Tax=Dysidea avara TaxID=196820 RepID=UPI003319428F
MNIAVGVVLVFCIVQGEGARKQENLTHCIGSNGYRNFSRCSGRCHNWSNVVNNFSNYFVSCTEIWFLPGIYNLDGHFPIVNAVNISLNGISSDDVAVTINCTKDDSFMSIYNSSLFEIHNITFINCGTSLIKVYDVLFPDTTSAALLLYNVLSAAITDVVFINSHGHGIIGYDLTGRFVLDRIRITEDRKLNTTYVTGGILMVFIDNEVNLRMSKIQSVLINNLQITHIFSNLSISELKRKNQLTDSVAIGIAFYQSNYPVNIQIQHSSITNLTSYKGSHICISHQPYVKNIVNFSNVSFTNNTNRLDFSLFKVRTMKIPNHLDRNTLFLIIKNCTISYNAMAFWQPFDEEIVLFINLTITLTEFSYNYKLLSTQKSMRFDSLVEITIKQCRFFSNMLNIEFKSIAKLVISGYNVFQNNTANNGFFISIFKSYPIFDGYNEFSNNTGNPILSFYRWATVKEGTVINMTNNKAFSDVNRVSKKHLFLIYVHASINSLFQCPFQVSTGQTFLKYRHFINVSISILNNLNYTYALYKTQLNSCYWQSGTAFNSIGVKNELSSTPGKVYKEIFNYNGNQKRLVNREGAFICTCNNNTDIDCFNDHIALAFPGETITINVVLLSPLPETAVHIDSSQVLNNSISPPCEVPLSKVYLVSNICTSLVYEIVSNSSKACSIYLKLMTADKPVTLFIYYLKLKDCPVGFQHINGSCICNPLLLEVFPGLMCDINTQTITRPMSSWIGSINNDTLYVEYCLAHFCLTKPSNIQLKSPDTQCINNRVGVMCGHCPTGFDSVLGSLKCKKCSNFWLFLLPVFLLAGILLIFLLFTLNLTVVDGKINGFLLYVSLMLGNNYNIFPTRNVLFVLMSLCNLDLGIETCFYHGMTEYDKTWLQFVFPFYLISIVSVLAITSRYCSSIERLTRRRVIPVIATILLLSYNKLLMATTKALFSYKTVYRLNDNSKQVIWMWDSSLSLISVKFIFLILAGLIVFLFVLLPLNFLLLFTKFSYRFKFVSKYLKPFLDAYQAPFNDDCRYFLGLGFVIRCVMLIFGNRILEIHQTLAVLISVNTAILIYLCTFKPFKKTFNTVLYVSFLCNTQCVMILSIFTNFKVSKVYSILFHLLVIIALMEFGGVVLYYFYINHLQKNKTLAKLLQYFVNRCQKHMTHCDQFQAIPLSRYEEFQDDHEFVRTL